MTSPATANIASICQNVERNSDASAEAEKRGRVKIPRIVTIFQAGLMQSALPCDSSDCHPIPGCTVTLWYNLFSFARGTWPANLQGAVGRETPIYTAPLDA